MKAYGSHCNTSVDAPYPLYACGSQRSAASPVAPRAVPFLCSLSEQARALSGPVDVLVATPTRFLQHVKEGNVFFRDIRWLVGGRQGRRGGAEYQARGGQGAGAGP